MVKDLIINRASREERERTARWMAHSEPWLTIGRTETRCLEVCLDPEYQVFVARQKDEPCGSIILQPRGLAGAPYIKVLVVDLPYRSLGIGAALLRFAEDHFRTTSRHLFLCVSSFNMGAQSFYMRNGYQKVGELPDFIKEGASEWLFHKRI